MPGTCAWREDSDIEPLIGRFLSRSQRDDMVELAGIGTFPGDRVASVEMVLARVHEAWQVAGFYAQQGWALATGGPLCYHFWDTGVGH